MSDENSPESASTPGDGPIPLGQRLFERPFLLLFGCLVIFFVFYTAWGWYEMSSLTQAPLP